MSPERLLCRQCGASGIVNFEKRNVLVREGADLEVISCRMCSSWLHSRPLVSAPMIRPVSFGPDDRKSAAKQALIDHSSECKRRGCSERYNASRSKLFLCPSCRLGFRYQSWLVGTRSKPAPLALLTDGTYVTRAEFVAMECKPQELFPPLHVKIPRIKKEG